MRGRILLGALVAMSAAACAVATRSSAALDLSTRRAELTRVHDDAAAAAGRGDFVGAVANAIAPEGFYAAAIATLGIGPAAARSFLMRDSLNARSRAIWTVVMLDVSADGNDGYSYGYLDVVRPNGDTLPGAFKAYWRRTADGRWQALALGRSPRTWGPRTNAPDSLVPRATSYRSWPMPDTLQARRTLEAAEKAFSDSARGNVRAAFMSFAAPHAGKVSGARYVFGPWAIGEDYRTPPPRFAGMSWYARWGTVAKSNDLGFNVGPVTVRTTDQQPQQGGQFFTVWRRQPNGEWKYVVD